MLPQSDNPRRVKCNLTHFMSLWHLQQPTDVLSAATADLLKAENLDEEKLILSQIFQAAR